MALLTPAMHETWQARDTCILVTSLLSTQILDPIYSRTSIIRSPMGQVRLATIRRWLY